MGGWSERKNRAFAVAGIMKGIRMTPIRSRIWSACALAIALAAVAPAQNGRKLTTPKEALGFEIGDDYYLANYTKLTAWWQKIATEYNRVKLKEFRKSVEGRPQ